MRTTTTGIAAVAGLLLGALPAPAAGALPAPAATGPQEGDDAGPPCVVLAIELAPEGGDTLLEMAIAGAPASLGARIGPGGGLVIDLARCVPGSEIAGRTFADGLVSAIQLLQGTAEGDPLSVAVETRRPFEYAVRSRADRVEVRLQPASGTRDADPSGAPAAEPGGDAPGLVRVLEPLPMPPPPAADPDPPPDAGEERAASAETVRSTIESLVLRWARAWSDQQVEDYLAFYAPSFRPSEGSRAAWEAGRRERLRAPNFIAVGLDSLEVRLEEPWRATASFWQSYSSDRFSDLVYKRLTWIEEDGTWRIAAEEVAPPPPASGPELIAPDPP